MNFTSHLTEWSKLDRAVVVAFALAEVLVQGGERVGIPELMRPSANRNIIEKIAQVLVHDGAERTSLPPHFAPAPFSEVLLLSDLWSPIEEFRRTIGQLAANGARGHVVQIVDPADLPRFGRNGIIASMQPVHQTSDRTMAEARLGTARLAGAYAWASMLKNGAHLAFGSDVPVESANPFPGLAAAITREDATGQPFGGWQPQERITREAALAAFSTGAAYAGQAEDRIGRLAPGLRADFILVDTDPLMATPAELRATRVLETYIDGQRVYRLK